MTERIRGLERRYLFTGDLVLQTAMHIGGGDITLGTTDSPVMRRADEQPFIPGSSLKGAFRSAVQKLAATVGLPNEERDVLDPKSEWIEKFNKRRRDEEWSDERTLREVAKDWPATALLFGTPYTASKIFFADAYLRASQETVIQRRDGVAIDRDSERPREGLKYDYEVVPPTLHFGFELSLENPTDTDLELTCLGLAEMRNGFFGIGGKRSSGLGRCVLEDFRVYALDLTVADFKERVRRLQRYLTGEKLEEKFVRHPDPDAFVEQQIAALLEGRQ